MEGQILNQFKIYGADWPTGLLSMHITRYHIRLGILPVIPHHSHLLSYYP